MTYIICRDNIEGRLIARLHKGSRIGRETRQQAIRLILDNPLSLANCSVEKVGVETIWNN